MSQQAPSGAENPPSDHAVRRHRRGLSSVLLPLLAVAVIGPSITAAWLTLHSNDSAAALSTPQNPRDVAGPPSSASPQPSSTQPVPAKPTPSAVVASPKPTPTTAKPTPTPTPTTAKPTPTAKPIPTAPVGSQVDRSVPVVVLNGTYDAGLAGFVRQRLRDLGWNVVRIGNWRGEAVTHTTVFTTGNTAAVRTMWHDLATGDRTQEPLASMSTGTLVIVLAADYHR